MTPHVVLERLLLPEPLVADRAPERSLSRVDPHVVHAAVLLDERLGAEGAGVGLLHVVRIVDVSVPGRAHPEPHGAAGAAERLLPRVDPLVLLQAAGLDEDPRAEGAAEGVLRRVDPQVLFVGGSVAVNLVAGLTRERAVARVVPQVRLVAASVVVNSAADVTSERFSIVFRCWTLAVSCFQSSSVDRG